MSDGNTALHGHDYASQRTAWVYLDLHIWTLDAGHDAAKEIAGAARTFKATYTIKTRIDDTKSEVAKRLNLATSDDLRSMKRELDRLQRQVERLKKEKEEREKAGQGGGEDK